MAETDADAADDEHSGVSRRGFLIGLAGSAVGVAAIALADGGASTSQLPVAFGADWRFGPYSPGCTTHPTLGTVTTAISTEAPNGDPPAS